MWSEGKKGDLTETSAGFTGVGGGRERENVRQLILDFGRWGRGGAVREELTAVMIGECVCRRGAGGEEKHQLPAHVFKKECDQKPKPLLVYLEVRPL